MTPATTYSAIVPVYNGEAYLRECLESILTQSLLPAEVFIVDDGSTDTTAQIAVDLASRGVTLLQKSNGGTASARNLGIEHSTATYVAFLDADDLWLPDKMAAQLEELANNAGVEVVTCLMQNFWEPEFAEEAANNPDLARPQPGVGSSVVARRTLFSDLGGLNEDFHNRDIQEWIIRAKGAGIGHALVDKPLVKRRIHANNLSRQRPPGEDELMGIAAKLLAAKRRRKQ